MIVVSYECDYIVSSYLYCNIFYFTMKELKVTKKIKCFDLINFDMAVPVCFLTRQKTNNARSKGVGLGWFINKKLSGNDIYEHSGGTGGYVSSMVIIPKTQEGIIILSNVSAFNRNSGHIIDVSYDLMKTLGL